MTPSEKTPATCGKEGVSENTATVEFDGVPYQNIRNFSIPATGHTVKIVGAKPATCVSSGYTGDRVCAECGLLLEKGEKIPRPEHNYVNGKCIRCGTPAPPGLMIPPRDFKAWETLPAPRRVPPGQGLAPLEMGNPITGMIRFLKPGTTASWLFGSS